MLQKNREQTKTRTVPIKAEINGYYEVIVQYCTTVSVEV